MHGNLSENHRWYQILAMSDKATRQQSLPGRELTGLSVYVGMPGLELST